MKPREFAANWLGQQPPAVSGQNGHNKTFSVAMALIEGYGLTVDEARPLLQAYSARCVPPWPESDIEHKLSDAWKNKDPAKVGRLMPKTGGHLGRLNFRKNRPTPAESTARPESETETFLKALFHPGEMVNINLARINDDGREIPDGAGYTFPLERWLEILEEHNGNIDRKFSRTHAGGIYICINPLTAADAGRKNDNVSAYRHVLIEFDSASLEEQERTIRESFVPVTTLTSSGGKSLHALVPVNALDEQEYRESVAFLWEHFARFHLDTANKNAARLSRLAGCKRGAKRQTLIATHIGADDFRQWRNDLILGERCGKPMSAQALLSEVDINDRSGVLLGVDRWMCKGFSAILHGPSGVGKSSLMMQMIIQCAVGMPVFGIPVARPLTSLVIQAENDDMDLAQMARGVCGGLDISKADLKDKFIIYRDSIHTGRSFCDLARMRILKHKPDIVWVDPLLSYLGDDINKQDAVSAFLRNGIQPILEETGVAWVWLHHEPKPSNDPATRKRKLTATEASYSMLGSSDITNWARTIMRLEEHGDGVFCLRLTKRGGRAGVDPNIWLRHGEESIYWIACDPPEPDVEHSKQDDRDPISDDAFVAIGLKAVSEGVKNTWRDMGPVFRDNGITVRTFNDKYKRLKNLLGSSGDKPAVRLPYKD